MKKAIELSILCNAQIEVVIFNSDGVLFEFCSSNDPNHIIQRYIQSTHIPHEKVTCQDLGKLGRNPTVKAKSQTQPKQAPIQEQTKQVYTPKQKPEVQQSDSLRDFGWILNDTQETPRPGSLFPLPQDWSTENIKIKY